MRSEDLNLDWDGDNMTLDECVSRELSVRDAVTDATLHRYGPSGSLLEASLFTPGGVLEGAVALERDMVRDHTRHRGRCPFRRSESSRSCQTQTKRKR